MIDNIIKNKEKNRGDKTRVGETGKLMSYVLYNGYVKSIFKSFGVQSWGGETGRHTGLKSQRHVLCLAGSNFPTKIPSPAH